MAKKNHSKTPDNYRFWQFFTTDWHVSGIMDTPVKCKCGEMTTRRDCHAKQEFFDDVTYTNYYCQHCGAFMRRDGIAVPLVRVEVEDESEGSDNE